MELLTIAVRLWRRRTLVLAGCAVIALLTLAMAHRLPGMHPPAGTPATGAGLGRVLVDRPRSLIGDVDPDGVDTAQFRAQLIADLMAGRQARRMVAQAAGLRESQLLINGPHVAAVVVGSPLSASAAEVATGTPASYVLGVNVAVDAPIVTLDTHTPDRASAARLVQAAVLTLRRLAATSEAQGPSAVVIDQLGPPRAVTIPGGGHSGKMALALGVVLMGAWCLAVLVIDRRRLRLRPSLA